MGGFERYEERWGERVDVRELDGAERVEMLPIARCVAIAPGATTDEPPWVLIEWAPGVVERPFPGSAIWRAVLHRYITEPVRADASQRVLRPLIAACLERYPTLESWTRGAAARRAAREERRARRGRGVARDETPWWRL